MDGDKLVARLLAVRAVLICGYCREFTTARLESAEVALLSWERLTLYRTTAIDMLRHEDQ